MMRRRESAVSPGASPVGLAFLCVPAFMEDALRALDGGRQRRNTESRTLRKSIEIGGFNSLGARGCHFEEPPLNRVVAYRPTRGWLKRYLDTNRDFHAVRR